MYSSLWHIVLEPSGGYEQRVFPALVSKEYPINLVPPQWVRSFAKASGLYAKIDRIDARLLASYGSIMNPDLSQSFSFLHEKLQSLIDRRSQIIEMKKSERNRLEKNPGEEITKLIKEHLEALNQQLLKVEELIKKTLNKEQYREVLKVLTEVRGVGLITAATLLATLPELGKLSKKKITRMVG